MIDEIRREMAQTYLIEAVRGITFFGCLGLIAFAIYVFGG